MALPDAPSHLPGQPRKRSAPGGVSLLTAGDGCGNAAPRPRRLSTAPDWPAATLTDIPRSRPLAKPEWGTKRICPSCGTRYYDLMRDPVVCPKCSTPFDPEAFLKARRARPATPVEKELEPVGADDLDADLEADEVEAVEEEEEDVPLDETEEEDEELIEDASELGEDEDDMAEVIDNVEDEEP
jgi:uncharacterized protein (TIGR02300 family)